MLRFVAIWLENGQKAMTFMGKHAKTPASFTGDQEYYLAGLGMLGSEPSRMAKKST